MCREKEDNMPDVNGSFSGKARLQTAVSLTDVAGHELQVAEIRGSQHSNDPNWDKAELTYWGVADIINGNGTQKGYFDNERADGDRDCGTFEGKVTTVQGETTLEGTWQTTSGTGKFTGVKAGGTYKGRVTSPIDIEMTWEGHYELAASKAA
jgi:hypothetical protein